MKTIGWLALVSLAVVACGGQVGTPETVDNQGGYGDGSGSGSGGSGYGSGTGGGGGYGSGTGGGYGSGTGGGGGYGTGTGTGGGGGYGSGTGGGGYGSGTGTGGGSGYGSGSGSGFDCGGYPPGDIGCSFPEGCTGELDCVDGEWTCEIDQCSTIGPSCAGDPPYCVDDCGDYEPSYCDGSGNWACPPSPPCTGIEDGGVITIDAGVLPP